MNPFNRPLPNVQGIAKDIAQAIWMDGFRTGAVVVAVIGIVLALFWSRK